MKSLRISVGLVTLLMMGSIAASQERIKLNTTCPRDIAVSAFQKDVKANGGVIDSVHLKQGMAVVVSAKTPAGIKGIQDAAERYSAKIFEKNKLKEHCRALQQAIDDAKVTLDVQKTATGVLFVYLTSDSALVLTIQGDCCEWCVCPGSGTQGCHRCC